MLLKAALNGSRAVVGASPVPVTRAMIVDDGEAAVRAGAGAIHVHVRDVHGRETLDPAVLADVLAAWRARCPEVPVGVSTGAWIARDPGERLAQVRGWEGAAAADFASVNLDEEGAVPLAELLLDKGIGVEAGLANPRAAEILVASGLAPRLLRILFEPEPQETAAALASTAAMEAILAESGHGRGIPRLLHGFDATTWDLVVAAAARGYDTRIGLEDTLQLPGGAPAGSNAELVRAALALLGTPRR